MANSIDSLVLSSVRSSSTSTAKTTSNSETSADRLGQAARLSVTPDAIADQAALVSLSGSSGSLTGVVNASIAVGGPDISGLQNQTAAPEAVAGQDFQNVIRTTTSSLVSGSETEVADTSGSDNSEDSTTVSVNDENTVDETNSSGSGVSIETEDEQDEDDQGENNSFSNSIGVVLDEEV